MANIVLCRIDSRLIHGQVVTKWVGQSQANRIAVVSDERSVYEKYLPDGRAAEYQSGLL